MGHVTSGAQLRDPRVSGRELTTVSDFLKVITSIKIKLKSLIGERFLLSPLVLYVLCFRPPEPDSVARYRGCRQAIPIAIGRAGPGTLAQDNDEKDDWAEKSAKKIV